LVKKQCFWFLLVFFSAASFAEVCLITNKQGQATGLSTGKPYTIEKTNQINCDHYGWWGSTYFGFEKEAKMTFGKQERRLATFTLLSDTELMDFKDCWEAQYMMEERLQDPNRSILVDLREDGEPVYRFYSGSCQSFAEGSVDTLSYNPQVTSENVKQVEGERMTRSRASSSAASAQ